MPDARMNRQRATNVKEDGRTGGRLVQASGVSAPVESSTGGLPQ